MHPAGGRAGQFPMRYGLNSPQNIMTVQIGMDRRHGQTSWNRAWKKLGIGRFDPYPSDRRGGLGGDDGGTKLSQMSGGLWFFGAGQPRTDSIPADGFISDYCAMDRRWQACYVGRRRVPAIAGAANSAEWDGKPMPRTLAPRACRQWMRAPPLR